MLQYLHCSLPSKSVPVYMGHYQADDISAIVMEFLPGQDMHQIRDWATKSRGRRIAIQDAVYLTAHVMLPLLQQMHNVGIVHRDVKPSNCVKRASKEFAMVDFGLSKSIVVPKDSPLADPEHPWTKQDWIRPPNYAGVGHVRKERPTAEFRGTSMYASVRVHQSRDYSPRDDIWSLMYVFCDFVSGGLPWMAYAANRDREACRVLKERIHGEEMGVPDQTQELLKGHEYHLAVFKRNKGQVNPPASADAKASESSLPQPLAMADDEKKIDLLRTAFDHLRKLEFWQIPDYDLIRKCLEGFLDVQIEDPTVEPINWELLNTFSKKRRMVPPLLGERVPKWELEDSPDPIEPDIFFQAEISSAAEGEEKLSGEALEFRRLPLELRFRIAQMDYNTLHHKEIAPHLALRDFLKVALPILYGEWDSRKFEKGGHRTDTDGYRRELYLKLVDKCLKCAERFNYFNDDDCVYDRGDGSSKKRRRINVSTFSKPESESPGTDLIVMSQALFRLRLAKKLEEKKAYAPPPLLTFGR